MSSHAARLTVLVIAALFFSPVLPDPAPAQTVSFIAQRDFAAGTNPRSVAVGDFNGDGIKDLAVTNPGSYPSYSATVSVLINGDSPLPEVGSEGGTCERALF